MATKKLGKVNVALPRELIKELDGEVARIRRARPGLQVSRAGTIREILAHWASLDKEDRSTEPRTHEGLLREARELKEKGHAALSEGGHRRARKLFLQSAARELEALVVAEEHDPRKLEAVTKTVLVQVMVLLKLATGYKHLPDVPHPRVRPEEQSD